MNLATKAVACIAKAIYPFLGDEVGTALYFVFGGDHVGLQVVFGFANVFRFAAAPLKNSVTLRPQHPGLSPDLLTSETNDTKIGFFARCRVGDILSESCFIPLEVLVRGNVKRLGPILRGGARRGISGATSCLARRRCLGGRGRAREACRNRNQRGQLKGTG